MNTGLLRRRIESFNVDSITINCYTNKTMTKPYDDSNWKQEYMSYVSDKFKLKLLQEGPHSLAQAWMLGAMYSDWKKIKGYDKLDPKSNEGQNQSSMKEFFERYKDQGI